MTVGITELPPEGMQLPGVALAGDADRGTKTTEGISLLFTTAGVTVQGPQPQIERLLVWSALDSATCREKIQLPDGREAAIMELTSGGQSIRFLLPSDAVSPGQAAYLDQALPTWLVRYKGVAPVAAAPVAPGAEAATAQEAEVGVALPAPGPAPAATQPVTQTEVAAEAPAPAFATAGATGAALGAAGLAAAGLSGEQPMDPSASNGQGVVAGGPVAAPPTMQAPPMQAPPAPPAPASPVMQAPPPPPPAPAAPTMPAPTMQAPPSSPPAPAAPVMPAAPVAPVMQTAPLPAPAPLAPPAPTGTAWDNPPLGVAAPDTSVPEPKKAKKPRFALTRKQLHAAEAEAAGAAVDPAYATPQMAAPAPGQGAPDVFAPTAKKAKKPRFALTRKQLHAAEAAAAGTAAVGVAATVDPAPAAPQAGVPAPPATVVQAGPAPAPEPKKAKKPRFALTRKQLHAAEAAAAGTAVVGAATATTAPPTAPPSDPVPLGVQLPPPVAAQNPAAAPPGQPVPAPGAPVAGDVVLADSGSKTSRRNLVLLVALLILVVAVGAGYLITKKSNTTTTAPPVTVPVGAADTALAAAINLRLTDLPTGWTQAPPAQAVVRPPVAPAAAQATASNAMASCLNTSYAVVSGLFDSGSLPGQTSLVQSPMFASAAGSTLEMASRTTTMSSPGQVQALNAVFTNPKFDLCYQQYRQTLAQAAVPGAAVQVQPVTLTAPTGVQSYGVVSTYTLPGAGTQVVGDAYVLGGRTVTVIQPSTDGAAIPSNVFAPAYDAVARRVAASASK